MGSTGPHRPELSARSETWLTPPEITAALGPFDLDPCGFPGWQTAERLICLPEDGLAVDWAGRVWLNPPYGREKVWTWLERLADHGQGTALILARTDTAGFVRTVWERADALLFIRGRLTFCNTSGIRSAKNAGAPSLLVAYGARDAAHLAGSGIAGTLVTRWRALPKESRCPNR